MGKVEGQVRAAVEGVVTSRSTIRDMQYQACRELAQYLGKNPPQMTRKGKDGTWNSSDDAIPRLVSVASTAQCINSLYRSSQSSSATWFEAAEVWIKEAGPKVEEQLIKTITFDLRDTPNSIRGTSFNELSGLRLLTRTHLTAIEVTQCM